MGYAGNNTAPTNGMIVSGQVAIGTTSVAGGYTLTVAPSATGNAISATAGTGTGVYGTSTGGNGVSGSSSSGFGGSGVSGTNSSSGSGVFGSSSSGFGVSGLSTSGYGIWCQGLTCGGTTTWTNTSDARLKTAVRDLPDEDGLSSILKLRPVRFHWIDHTKDKAFGDRIGFIAQDLEKVFPEFVVTKGDTKIDLGHGKTKTITDTKSIGYAEITVPLVKAIQELKAENDELRAANESLSARVDALEAKQP
jgi:hypothetical protein